MFVRMLVSGVRSSCDASATRFRCAATERSSEASIALTVEASRLSSSSPVTSIRRERSARPRDVLGRLRQPPHGPERGPRDEQPEQRGAGDADERDRDQDRAEPPERLVHLVERPRDQDGEARGELRVYVRTRRPSSSTIRNAPRRRPAATSRSLGHDRDSRDVPCGHELLPVRRDDLGARPRRRRAARPGAGSRTPPAVPRRTASAGALAQRVVDLAVEHVRA